MRSSTGMTSHMGVTSTASKGENGDEFGAPFSNKCVKHPQCSPQSIFVDSIFSGVSGTCMLSSNFIYDLALSF